MATRWIEHEGTAIFEADFTGLDEAACIEAIEQCKQELLAGDHPKHAVLLLTRCDPRASPAVGLKWREFRLAVSPILRAWAVVGLKGLRRAVAQLTSRGPRFARDDEEAKSWLVSR